MIKVNATIRRLSDEEPDPLEHEDSSSEPTTGGMGWAPWGPDTIQDVYNVVAEKLTPKQREIIEAHLAGYNYHDLAVTQKYWRYNYQEAIKKIRKELRI